MQTNIKKEVSCKALDTIFGYAKQKNIELDSLIVDVPYDLSYLLNKRERIEWWVWCKIISNSRRYFDLYEFEEMGRGFVSRGSYWEGILWAFFLFTSNKFSRLLYNQIFKIGASMFSCIKHHTDFIDTNRFIATAQLDEDYELPEEWALMCKGVWEQLGAKIGQKGFKVDATVNQQEVIFDVSWKKESLFFKIKTGIKWLFNIKKALLEITESRDALLSQYQDLEKSQNKLQKQTTQLKTAYKISTSVHQSVNINDTLKAIADALVNEAGFSAAFIRLEKDVDDNYIDVRWQKGAIMKLNNSLTQDIIIKGNKVGAYLVNPTADSNYTEDKELLEYLTPVINVAIHDALVLRAVSDYKDNLEQKVSDRTTELQKARDELSESNKLLKQAHQAQSRFFTNISHEFRTPLTLILGPAKRIMEKSTDDEFKSDADFIQRNAKKLNKLVDELLDISKIESGEMKLKACPVNIVSFVKDIAYSFSALAERKKITFNVDNQNDGLEVYLDKEKVDKIVSNVLSNAFKFTPEDGKVELKIIQNEINAELIISDTGIGIAAAKIDKIFDRFYQVDSGHTREQEGTGIGLALTKELVELHKGRIEVESEAGKGTAFRIYLPLGKDHLEPEEICEEETSEVDTKEEKRTFSDLEETIENQYEKQLADKLSEKPTLLLVEDNVDVRKYIINILEDQYKIYEARDGEEGLSKSLECIPDLIISDIMMPKLDGFQLCSKLKTDSRTSHIPVIMLTAKATMEDKISGLETGADEYLMKPFEEQELKVRIRNLLEQRKKLHEYFRQYGLVGPDIKNITTVDQKFLHKAGAIMNEHISDTSFSVEIMADKMAVSKSLLFKKINSLMGSGPGELIKRTRLNKAAKLLESKSGNISEIALEVGFNNPSYFAECFKKQFGIVPSLYSDKSDNN